MPEDDPNPVRDTLIRIATDAQGADLDFLLIGGHAVIHYGVPRFTRDVDFLIPDATNQSWRSFLAQHGFELKHGTPGFEQFYADSDDLPRIDLMLVDDGTWKQLRQAAHREALTADLELLLAAPEHLIAMKLRAANSKFRARSEQDWSDIAELIVQCELDLEDPEFREFIARFGGPEAVATVQKRVEALKTS